MTVEVKGDSQEQRRAGGVDSHADRLSWQSREAEILHGLDSMIAPSLLSVRHQQSIEIVRCVLPALLIDFWADASK